MFNHMKLNFHLIDLNFHIYLIDQLCKELYHDTQFDYKRKKMDH